MEKESFFESRLCRSRVRCGPCRSSAAYRKVIAGRFDVPSENFECPFGVTVPEVKEKPEVKEPEMPGIASMAKSAGREAVKTAVAAAQGKPIVADEDEVGRRWAICVKCEFMNLEKSRCRQCGCFMQVKTRLKQANCPIGKW